MAEFLDAAPASRADRDALWARCLERCRLEELDAGWDCGSMFHGEEDGALGMSVSDGLEEGPVRDAWLALLDTLRGEDEPCPWITALGSGDAGDSAVVRPQALLALVERVRSSGAIDAVCSVLEADGNDASGVRELGEFLTRAADSGAWVVWRNT